jgi:hypothetical protein
MTDTIKIKLVNTSTNTIKLAGVNIGGGYVPYPQNTPTIVTQAISDLSNYSNTSQVMSLIDNAVANIHVSDLSDVVLSSNPPDNNSSLVYNTANNKYVVEQIPVDGGTF